MPRHSIYESFLLQQGLALFESLPGGQFVPLGHPPDWAKSLWRTSAGSHLNLAERSPFLENFLAESARFWDSASGESPDSGTWTEQDSAGNDYHLEASALWLDGRRILLVRNLGSIFSARQQVYQTARDSLLAHERLVHEIQKKEILLHTIIHDLSQPLTAMRGCFDLLLVETLPPNIAKFVNIGHRESLRQEQMIRGILEAFSADLSAEQSLGKDAAGPPDLALSSKLAVEQFSPPFFERGVKLVVDRKLDDSLDWRVIGDTPRIERIFGNLLENALRYSPRGSTVTVGLEDRGSSILAFVDDEGPGLPSDASHDRIFALFSKGKDRPGKAGLGLYFCKMTVERWGGTIGADNRPGGGSRFWFRLLRAPAASAASVKSPAPAAPPVTLSVPSAPAPAPKPSPAPPRPLRILIADDNETILELAVEILRSRGHFVTPVSDGAAALDAFVKNKDRNKFDVVVLDQEMPRLNGLETARAICEKEKKSGALHTRLVSLTGNATPEDSRRIRESGFDALLPKPFERNALYQVIESGFSASPDASAAAPSAAPLAGAVPAPPEDLVAHLARLTNDNAKLRRTLISSFLSDAPKKIAAIRRALARKNANDLAASAHSLKGAIAIFQAEKLVAAARALEAMGRAHNLKGAADEFRLLTSGLEELFRNLRALLPRSPRRAKPRRSPRSRKTRP
ncbi:MAG TPA: ATP-binding protein [Candidatus Acidoferrum sp.]|nr:ATP-binding protein [Candidatus Acidoferrum sp.]